MILDAYGKPIQQAALKEPQTARVARYQRPWHDSALRGLKPRDVARMLADADAGGLDAQARLFADMEDRDAMIAAAMQQRALSVARLPWKITPPKDASAAEKRAAEGAAELLEQAIDALEDVCVALLDAVGYGYSAVEIAWKREGGLWLADLYPRPHGWFVAADDGRSIELSVDGGSEPLRPFGWILHQPRLPRAGYVSRGGVYRSLVWPFVYKAYAIGDFAEFLETFGLPFVVGKYGREATEEDKSRLLQAVASLAHDARAIMPLEMQLEIQRVSSSGTDSPHLAMVRWADEAIARALLGQTLSTQAKSTGLGSGVADLQSRVREDIRDADARQLAATLTRDLIWPLCALNFGLTDARRCPRLSFDTAEPEDIETYAKAIPALAAAGVKIPERWVRERLGIPEPMEDEPVLGGGAPAGPPADAAMTAAISPLPAGEGPGVRAVVARNAGTDEAMAADQQVLDDALTAIPSETLMRQAWEAASPAVRRVLAAGDYDTALGLLAELYPAMPDEGLQELLSRLLFAAQVWGALSADAEMGDGRG